MRALVIALALVLAGCSSTGLIGGGRPTTITCKGKGAVTGGAIAFQADCGPGFEFTINVQ